MPREPWEWEEADLLRLISDQVEESRELEYKASGALGQSDSKKTEISKDVSSFAHSVGGTIIYGIQESSGKAPRIPVALDEIDPSQFSKERLEDVITSRIHRRIDGIRIKSVELSGTQSGKVAYVVHIPQSNNIHQAHDHRFYKRFNFKSTPMEQYEIEDVLNRVMHPKVVAFIEAEVRSNGDPYDEDQRISVSLKIRLSNIGKNIAENVSIQFWIPDGYNPHGQPDLLNQNGGRIVDKEGKNVREFLYYHRQEHQVVVPMFPNTSHDVLDGNFAFINLYLFRRKAEQAHFDRLTWNVYADNAPTYEGSIPMSDLFFAD
jgi:hypothetical protein